jgi:hypothetical protein
MTPACSGAADLVFGTVADRGPLDASGFLGHWRNTNPQSSRIRELTIQAAEGAFTIQIWGAVGDARVDWGVRRAQAFACIEENAVPAASLFATYDFGFMTMELQLRLNKGILPLMSFSRFRDDSGRSNYYTREFFYRNAGAPEAC